MACDLEINTSVRTNMQQIDGASWERKSVIVNRLQIFKKLEGTSTTMRIKHNIKMINTEL